MSYSFALIDESKLVTQSDLFRLAWALEQNGQHCAAAWGLQPPAVVVMDAKAKAPRNVSPVVFVDGSEQDPGALAVHYFDVVRNAPASIVYVDRASGWNTGTYSACEAASHEIVESIVNPYVNLWNPHPNPERAAQGVQVARESADPVQDTYDVQAQGTAWRCSNFVTPAWFDGAGFSDPEIRQRVLNGSGYDYARRLRGPGSLAPSGYVILRRRENGRFVVWFEDVFGHRFGAVPTSSAAQSRQKHSPTARGKLLAEKCGGVLEMPAEDA